MNTLSPPLCPTECGLRMVCHCLQITEAAVIEAVATRDLKTIREIRKHTGAGDGCTACHHHLRALLEGHT